MKKKILSWLILAGFIIAGIIFLKNNLHDFKNILNVKFGYVVIILFTIFLKIAINGWKFKILAGLYDIRLRIKEWLGLEVIAVFGNHITPFRAAGISIKAAYLKKKYKFPYTYFAGVTGLTYLIDVMVLGILGFFLSLFLPLQNELKYGLSIFFVLVFLASVFILFFLPLPIRWNIRLLKYIAKSISQLKMIRHKKTPLLKLIPICLGRVYITSVGVYLSFRAFDFTVPFHFCVLIRILLSFSALISLTPRNLGIQEAIIIIFSKIGGATTLTASFAAVLYRAVSFILILLLSPIFGFILSRKTIFNTPPPKEQD